MWEVGVRFCHLLASTAAGLSLPDLGFSQRRG
jgi:hypothetical protein